MFNPTHPNFHVLSHFEATIFRKIAKKILKFSLFIAVLNVPSNKKKLRFLKFFDFGKNKQQNSKSVSVAVRVFVNEVIFYAQTTLTYVEHPP